MLFIRLCRKYRAVWEKQIAEKYLQYDYIKFKSGKLLYECMCIYESIKKSKGIVILDLRIGIEEIELTPRLGQVFF